MEEEFLKLEFEKRWEEHMKILTQRSRNHSHEVGESATNKSLNRYQNVVPYDRSRIRLTRTESSDYINANLVTVPKAARQYILTQGPLLGTLSHFWLMIWEQKSNIIVMLNRTVENFSQAEYWPKEIKKPVLYEDVKLSVTLKSIEDAKHYTIRELLLEDKETQKSRTVSQFHYTAWPDNGSPDSPTSFLRLLTAIRKSGNLDKMDEPAIVHCSAGIGRSGTFCLIDSVLSMIESQGSIEGIDIASTLVDMRDYRMGLIQSPEQLRFAYMTIFNGIKILEKANKLHPHISSIKDSSTSNQLSFSQPKTNGAGQNGKKGRRNKRKQGSSNNSGSLNIFNKHLLVDAMDDVDSDAADSLFYDTMKPRPSMKKPRNSSPNDFNDDFPKQIHSLNNGSADSQPSDTTHIQDKTSSVPNSMWAKDMILTPNPISTKNAPSIDSLLSSASSQNTDSVLVRRRERELRNQKLAEKTMDIKNRMKAEELKREQQAGRMAFFKRSALFGGVAIVLSSIVYVYLNGNSSP